MPEDTRQLLGFGACRVTLLPTHLQVACQLRGCGLTRWARTRKRAYRVDQHVPIGEIRFVVAGLGFPRPRIVAAFGLPICSGHRVSPKHIGKFVRAVDGALLCNIGQRSVLMRGSLTARTLPVNDPPVRNTFTLTKLLTKRANA